VGSAAHAVAAAREAAEAMGYAVRIWPTRVTGEAREVAPAWLSGARALARETGGRCCILSAGETTVRVEGDGLGGRNLEFALALAEPLRGVPGVVVASVGTDGVDGTSGVAGAVVDGGTAERAESRGLMPAADFLRRNDSFHYFGPLGDTVRTGRTDTNVGDLQVLLMEP